MSSGSSETETQVAVLGAGLTGLSAALSLQEFGVPYRLFEKASTAGGLARTHSERGYRFDCTGHLLHLRNAELKEQVHAWLDGEYIELERNSVIFSQGVYTAYPFQANTHGLPRDIAYECVGGFIEAYLREPKPDPQNFEEYCLVNFGKGISRHFMLPYNARLWGVPPDQISVEWCKRFVPTPSLDDVIAGAVGHEMRPLGYNARFLYPKRGMGMLPSAMARRLGNLEFNCALTKLDAERKLLFFSERQVKYQTLISSLPLTDLVALLSPCPAELVSASHALRATHLYYLDVALHCEARKDFHWVYVPEARYPFYRVGCYSNFSSELAPPGKSNLYVELVDRQAPQLAELLPSVTKGLIDLGFVGSERDIAFARLRRIDCAYVLFDSEREAAMRTISDYLTAHDILSRGRYGSWTYASMEDALLEGQQAAKHAEETGA